MKLHPDDLQNEYNLTPEEWSATFTNMKKATYKKRSANQELRQLIDEITYSGCSLCYTIENIEDLISHFGGLLQADYLPEDHCFLVYLKRRKEI